MDSAAGAVAAETLIVVLNKSKHEFLISVRTADPTAGTTLLQVPKP